MNRRLIGIVFAMMVCALCYQGPAWAVTLGTTDGTYDFGSLGLADSAGTGYARLGDKFKVGNGLFTQVNSSNTGPLTALYATSGSTASYTSIIQAEGGSICRTFTFKDLGVSAYVAAQTFNSLNIVLKDVNGVQIGATISLGSSGTIPTTSVTNISTLYSHAAWSIDNVASIEVTYTIYVSGAAGQAWDLNFENITIANVSAPSGAPIILSASPTYGPRAAGTPVVITGGGFTGATAVRFGGTNAVSYTVNSASQITAVAPAGTVGSVVHITVTTPLGTNTTGTADQYTYITNTLGTADDTYNFGSLGAVDSAGTGSTQLGDKFKVGNTLFIQSQNINTGPPIAIYTSASTTSAYTAVISAEGGSTCKTFTFKDLGISAYMAALTFNALDIVLKDINGVQIGSAISLGSSGTISTTSVTNISTLYSHAAWSIDNVASIEISYTLNAGGTPAYSLNLNFENITISNVSAPLPAPTVTGISPSSGPTTGGTPVTITGTNFTGTTAVTIGGAAASGVTVVSATTITAVTPAGTAGARDVVVTAPGGVGTGAGVFTYIPTYTVAYNGNGNTGGSVPIVASYFGGATVTVSGNTGSLVRTGHTFTGWNTAADNSGTTYSASGSATFIMAAANVTLYAQWSINNYTVTFTTDGHGTLSGTTSQTIIYGLAATAVTATPSFDYHFTNWTGTNGFVTTTTNPLVVSGVTATMTITANFTHDAVNGLCGLASGRAFTSQPAANLCSQGTSTAMSGSGPWTWTCSGQYGGTDATGCFANIDTAPPTLILSTLSNGARTNNATLNVSGTASDAYGIQSVVISSQTVSLSTANNIDYTFSYPVTLVTGSNVISIIATDIAENTTTDTRTIVLDQIAPSLTLINPSDNSVVSSATVTVSGTTDTTATVLVSVNSGPTVTAAVNATSFNLVVSLSANAMNSIHVTAIDLANNAASATRTVTNDQTNPSLAITTPNQDMGTNQTGLTLSGTVGDLTNVSLTATCPTASVGAVTTPSAGTWSVIVTNLQTGVNSVTITATDQAGNSTSVIRNIVFTATPVTINPVTSPTTTNSQIISGTREENAIVDVLCPTASVGIVTYPSTTTWQTDLTLLTQGTNTITVTATDALGNASPPITAVIALNTGSLGAASGDITSDGVVDIRDALKALIIATELETATAGDLAAGDVAPFVNGTPQPDGNINVGDVVVILRKAIGLVNW